MTDTNNSSMITLRNHSSLLSESSNKKDQLTLSEAYEIIRQVNSSKRGRAYIENNELVIKELIVG